MNYFRSNIFNYIYKQAKTKTKVALKSTIKPIEQTLIRENIINNTKLSSNKLKIAKKSTFIYLTIIGFTTYIIYIGIWKRSLTQSIYNFVKITTNIQFALGAFLTGIYSALPKNPSIVSSYSQPNALMILTCMTGFFLSQRFSDGNVFPTFSSIASCGCYGLLYFLMLKYFDKETSRNSAHFRFLSYNFMLLNFCLAYIYYTEIKKTNNFITEFYNRMNYITGSQ